MSTDRWSVKIAAKEPGKFDPEAHVPVFHRWIQQSKLPVGLIDVADYAHVTDGPGVLLVSNEYNIYADKFDGLPGLTVQRKARGGVGSQSLVETLRIALLTAQGLAGEASLPGSKFDVASIEIVLNDRLRGPNTDEGWKTAEPVVREAAKHLFGDGAEVERVTTDAGARLTAKISGSADSADALLKRIDAH